MPSIEALQILATGKNSTEDLLSNHGASRDAKRPEVQSLSDDADGLRRQTGAARNVQPNDLAASPCEHEKSPTSGGRRKNDIRCDDIIIKAPRF
eukprot:scaffold10_cov257-Pinguiococcus_pyrenoidosus.AAC.20